MGRVESLRKEWKERKLKRNRSFDNLSHKSVDSSMLDTESIQKEYNELLEKLSDPELVSNWEKMEELSKKKSYLEKNHRETKRNQS